MKKTASAKRFQTTPRTFFVASVILVSTMMPGWAVAQTDHRAMTTDDIINAYHELENELLRRFDIQVKVRDEALRPIVLALAHIRSKKAIPLFLDNITVVPNPRLEKVGDIEPVQIVKGGNNLYIMLVALIEIGGIPLEQCIAELEKVQSGSLRETLLLYLGQKSYGEWFKQAIQNHANASEDKEKWQRVLDVLSHPSPTP